MSDFANPYQSLYDYIKTTVENIEEGITFFHGRKEVLHEYDPTPGATVCWLLPFTTTANFTNTSGQLNRTFTINMIFYQRDNPGSEINQNDQDTISPEMQVIATTDQLCATFVRLFNNNTLTDTLEELSDELEVTGMNTDVVIKDNDYFLTGTLLNMTVLVPDDFDYCALPTTPADTSDTLENVLEFDLVG